MKYRIIINNEGNFVAEGLSENGKEQSWSKITEVAADKDLTQVQIDLAEYVKNTHFRPETKTIVKQIEV